jgi:hypothetical protein
MAINELDKPRPDPKAAHELASEAPTEIPVTLEQINSIKACVGETIRSYKRKRRRNKIGAILVHVLTVVFTVGTTILIGWKLAVGKSNLAILNNALILSALSTGVSMLDAIFDYKALWVSYNISISRLKSIITRIQYLESIGVGNLKQKQIEDLYLKYESVCSQLEKDYKDIRASDDE